MERTSRKSAARGFTLIEMLIVIAIIAVLVATVIPVVSSKLNSAKEATCAANRRSLLTVLTMAYVNGEDVEETFQAQKAQYTCPFGGTIRYFLDESNGKVIITCSHLEAEIGDALTKLYGGDTKTISSYELSSQSSDAYKFYISLSAEQKDVLDSYQWSIVYLGSSKSPRIYFADKTVTSAAKFTMYKYDASRKSFQCTPAGIWMDSSGHLSPNSAGSNWGWYDTTGSWKQKLWSSAIDE